ncbi:MAG: anti-sigma factor antagonist [Coriobacteriia bacterium]|nr:anti-sigma factor antagonist [Coriobacteriia bacterium]
MVTSRQRPLPTMAFTTERYENLKAAVCRIEGDLDLAVVPELQESLAALLDTGYYNIVLDMADVRYVDSSALGLLVWLDRRLSGIDGKVVMAGANRDIRRILEVSRLASVTPTLCASGDVAEALDDFDRVEGSAKRLWARALDMVAGVENLAHAREKVAAWIAPLGFSDAALFDIRVALGEALANAVRHGSAAQDGLVTVGVDAYEDRVAISVTDRGTGFDGEHVCSDDLYAAGGRGVMFMRALMDSVVFEPATGGGTIVTLVKHRPAAE